MVFGTTSKVSARVDRRCRQRTVNLVPIDFTIDIESPQKENPDSTIDSKWGARGGASIPVH